MIQAPKPHCIGWSAIRTLRMPLLPVAAGIFLIPGSGAAEEESRARDEFMLDISVHPGFPYLDSTSRSICARARRKLCILT
jgi:hypothetical protein